MPSGKEVVEIARGGGVVVMVAMADLVVSATEVAVTIALIVLVKLAGASYWTEKPDCMLNPPKPERLQVTPFPEASFETVTVRVTDWPCKMVCELPPLKLIAIGGVGGVEVGALALELQPERTDAASNLAPI